MTTHEKTGDPARLPVVFILGPTASGKTAVGIELYQQHSCRLISVDSSLVYRGMNIGTAKPSLDEQRLAPHHLIDICDPWDTYSAARFCSDARREISRAHEKGQVPVLIGGTMLYFKALEEGLANMPEADAETRQSLSLRGDIEGWEAMHQYLASVDPQAAQRIHPNDPQRIQRALEVWEVSGVTLTEWQTRNPPVGLANPVIKCGLLPADRAQLHHRIEQRFDVMLEAGFISELEQLSTDSRINASLPAMRSVGYRQGLDYLSGRLSANEFREKSIVATRQLAKRQMTWMRGMNDLQCYDSLSLNEVTIVQRLKQQIDGHRI